MESKWIKRRHYEITVLSARRRDKGSMKLQVDLLLHAGPVGLKIRDVALFQSGTERWIAFPSRARFDDAGEAVVKPNGKIDWMPLVEFPYVDDLAFRKRFALDVWELALEHLEAEDGKRLAHALATGATA